MVATQYLPPVTDTPAIGHINNAMGYLAGATSIVVATDQGTFPSPAAGQAFVAVINPNVSGLLDNATTERCIVTVNSSGTWTIPAGTAFNHSNGENVAIVLSTTWLSNLLQQLLPATVQTGNFNAAANTFYPLDTTSGALTATLPTTPPNGTIIGFKVVAPTPLVNLATVAAGGSDVLNLAGTSTATIKVTGEAQQWVYNSATAIWYAESSTPVGQLDLRYATSAQAAAAIAAANAAAAAAISANTASTLFISTQSS